MPYCHLPHAGVPPAFAGRPPDTRFQWQAIFESSAAGMALVSPTGRWLEVNRCLTEMVGYSREEMLRMTFQDITHPDDLDSDLGLVTRMLNGEIDKYSLEKRYLTRHGEVVPVNLTVSLMRDDDGLPDYFISVIEDHREQAEARRQLIEMQRELSRNVNELEAANRELEAFGYSVSHDLRAPLRAIDGFTRLALEAGGDQLGEPARRHLQRVQENAQRLSEMIQGLHHFSLLGRKSLAVRTVDPAIQVERQYRLLTAEMSHRPKLHLGELPRCEADPVLLERVWSNLLSNALKFSSHREAPRIEVGSVAQDDGELAYFVRDNGAGFEMSRAHQLFTVFRRLHGQDRFPGQGVGLALVRSIVERHGGRVWAEGEPGRGAVFYFTLGCGEEDLA